MTRARELIEGAPGDEEPDKVRQRNRDFHFLFYERCGMPGLTERIAGMWQAFPWDLMLTSDDRRAASRREHLDILREVEQGDPDRAAAATELHLRNGFSAILCRLADREGPDPFEIDVD